MKQTDFGVQITRFFTMYLPTRRDLSDNTISSYRDAFKLVFSLLNTISSNPVISISYFEPGQNDFVILLFSSALLATLYTLLVALTVAFSPYPDTVTVFFII